MNPSLEVCIKAVQPHLETIVSMLRVGHTRTACAKAVGIKPWQLFAVTRHGKVNRGRAQDMLAEMLRAEGMAQVQLEAIVIEDAKVNVKTAQWLLARRFRLKERHEADIDILRKLDYNRLAQEEVKLEMLKEKHRLLTEKSGKDLDGEGWRDLMNESETTSDRIKSIH
tara:strand:+ start:1907 stop:2410 length:504 start_codon:yes stop_codon:yes gene_type:complete